MEAKGGSNIRQYEIACTGKLHTLLLKRILISFSLGCVWLRSYIFKQLRNLWASLGECKAHLPSDSYSECLLTAQLAAGCRRKAPLKYLKWAVYNTDNHTYPVTEWEHKEHTRVGWSFFYLHASFSISPQLSIPKLNFCWKKTLKLHMSALPCVLFFEIQEYINYIHKIHVPCETSDPLQLFTHCPFYHHVISVGLFFFPSIIKKSSPPSARSRDRGFCVVVRFTFSKHQHKSENNQELHDIVFLKLR